MLINLYYIEGISRIDTPYFATKTIQASLQKQEEFFDNHLVHQVELGYYPPHYRNTIRFDSDDLVLNETVNYISLDYRDKRYYYFIDNINYISEDILEIEITMDVIQTYMFDIYIANGIIERKFINRWVHPTTTSTDWIINRDYVRENVSNNEFVFNSNEVLNGDTKKWWVFAPCTKYINLSERTMKIQYDHNLPGLGSNSYFTSSYPTFVFPWYDCKYTGDVYFESNSGELGGHSSVTNVNPGISESLAKFTSMNTIVDMYICPFEFNDNLYIDGYGYLIVDSSNYLVMQYTMQVGSGSYHKYAIAPWTSGTSSIGFVNTLYMNVKKYSKGVLPQSPTRVTTINTSFNVYNITQMLDENYIQFTYGSIASYTSIPLFELRTNNVDLYAGFNPSDGTRLSWITRAYDNTYEDKYNTVTLDSNILHFDLKNDPWVNYVSANRARWVGAYAKTAVDIFTKGMSKGLTNKFAKQDMTSILSNPKSFDKRYKLPHLRKKPQLQMTGLQCQVESNNMDTAMSAVSSFGNNVVEQYIQDYNVKCQPPTAKQIANVSDIGAKGAFLMVHKELVNDFSQCANYYHRNAFLVNEYIDAKADIFGYIQNRYFFNVLKMQVPNVHLHNVIEDDDSVDAIKDRLLDGVRLWNVNNTGVVIGDFSKDNVEYDYLS